MDLEAARIPTRLFIKAFQPQVRVLLRWDQVEEKQYPAYVDVFTDSAPFENWFAPWYCNSQGLETEYMARDARPLSIADIATDASPLSTSRRGKIEALSHSFCAHEIVQIVVGLYALPHGKYLVLDGNHRLVAALRSRRPMTILAFTLVAPVDSQLLADLRHW